MIVLCALGCAQADRLAAAADEVRDLIGVCGEHPRQVFVDPEHDDAALAPAAVGRGAVCGEKRVASLAEPRLHHLLRARSLDASGRTREPGLKAVMSAQVSAAWA